MAVIHRTPGLIPVEAFTVAGLSVKPNSRNPIGKFGTGLKYAIAVLTRMDIKVTVFIGQTEYVFYKKKRSFRGHDYFAIRMKKRKGLNAQWTYHELPITTEYGKYWELWQVFRELHANTLDEGGRTYLEHTYQYSNPFSDETTFVIEGPRYEDVYYERDRIFLPDGIQVREGAEAIQVIDRPSKHIYFRGMRIMDLRKEAMFTYNFLEDVDLTEDRTAKYPSILEARIVATMQESEDTTFLERTVARPREDSFERSLNHTSAYTSYYIAPVASRSYLAAAQDSPNVTAKEVWNRQQPTVPSACDIHIRIPKPALDDDEVAKLQNLVKGIHPDSTITGNVDALKEPS